MMWKKIGASLIMTGFCLGLFLGAPAQAATMTSEASITFTKQKDPAKPASPRIPRGEESPTKEVPTKLRPQVAGHLPVTGDRFPLEAIGFGLILLVIGFILYSSQTIHLKTRKEENK